MISKEEAHKIALEVVSECRMSVDRELEKLHAADLDNAWTEEKATRIANAAALIAVDRITNDFYMSVGKKTVTALGAAVVATVIIAKDWLKHLTGFK